MKVISITCILVCILFLSYACNSGNRRPLINYSNYSTIDGWEINIIDSTSNHGNVKIQNKIWLMHFLHWWPLTKDNEELSISYAKNMLANLWGMEFKMNGVVGENIVNGHKAFYAEGIYNNIVKTRFIVWNCPESGRQFLSDCNINIALNTPNELFDLQINNITQSVCCHDSTNKNSNPILPNQINYDEEELSFKLPSNWRSGLYLVDSNSNSKLPGYYKEGITNKRGVIWNLISDSEKEINLIWEKNIGQLSEDKFKLDLYNFFRDTSYSTQDTFKIRSFFSEIKLNKTNIYSNFYEIDGEYNVTTDLVNYMPIDTSKYCFSAFCWTDKDVDFMIIASMVAYDNIWGVSIDLKPTKAQFRKFINDNVLLGIKNHPVVLNN